MSLTLISDPVDAGASSPPEEADRRARLARDPVLSAVEPPLPEPPRHAFATQSGSNVAARNFALLQAFASAHAIHFIADAYWTTRSNEMSVELPPRPAPLYEVVDRLAGARIWERTGTLIRMRSHTWFLERAAEVPLREVRRWQAGFRERGGLPLSEYARMARTLTDAQIATLVRESHLMSLPPDVVEVYAARHALRFYASLGATQQQALGRGTPLPLARLSPAQQGLFLTAVKEEDGGRTPLMNLPGWEGAAARMRVGEQGDRSQQVHLSLQYAPDVAVTVTLIVARSD